jgi:hypothetical protein
MEEENLRYRPIHQTRIRLARHLDANAEFKIFADLTHYLRFDLTGPDAMKGFKQIALLRLRQRPPFWTERVTRQDKSVAQR